MALRTCDSCECCQGGDARASSSSESAIGTPASRDATSIVDYEECYLSRVQKKSRLHGCEPEEGLLNLCQF